MTADNGNTSPIDYTNEEWRDIPGWRGVYQVSDSGRVRSLDTVIKTKTGQVRRHKGRVLVLNKPTTGYRDATLSMHGNRERYLVHRLVVMVFIGEIPKGMEINHINGVRNDNRLSNLEIVTRSENHYHASRVLGTMGGEKHGMSILTESDVREIRKLRKTGKYTLARLGELFYVAPSTIHAVIKRVNWSHVE